MIQVSELSANKLPHMVGYSSDSVGDAASREYRLNEKLKLAAYKKLLDRTQKRMNVAEKLTSKVVHQSQLELLGEFAGKTIGHSWGILGAGVISVLGSLLYSIASAYYSLAYNESFFIFLISLGFATGITAKLLYKITH